MSVKPSVGAAAATADGPVAQAVRRGPARRLGDAAGDCLALTKPRVTLLVMLTAVASAYVGARAPLETGRMLALALGTGLLAGGAAALNQFHERRTDALMARTRARPLPAGRLRPPPAALLGSLMLAAGGALLWRRVDGLCAGLGVATAAVYLLAYTPLKFRSPISTLVGAAPGAGPVLMGWAASRGTIDAGGWALFAIQFLWQFPHFLAIAWLYREQYERAGIRMLPVVEGGETETARQVLLYSLALIPVSLLPTVLGFAGTAYFAGALLLGLALLAAAWRTTRAASRPGYRRLLQATVLYLPLLFGLMAWDRVPHP